MRDLHHNMKPSPVLGPVPVASGAVLGAIVDSQGCQSLEYVIASGVVIDGTFTPSLEQGDEADLSDTTEVVAADLLGTVAGATFGPTDSAQVKRIGYRGTKRYTRLTLTPSATSAAFASATATLLADLAAAEKLTINGHDFVARAKHATGTVAFSTVVADNVVTVAGSAFTAKLAPSGASEFALGASDAEALVNLAAAVNAHPTVGLLVQMDGATGVITAVAAGAPGNLITLVKTGSPITLSGLSSGKLSGAYDASLNEWPLESTLPLSAAALAAAINASATAGVRGVVRASAAEAVVTVKSSASGTVGNLVPFVATGAHINVTGSGHLASGVTGGGMFGAIAVGGHPVSAPVA